MTFHPAAWPPEGSPRLGRDPELLGQLGRCPRRAQRAGKRRRRQNLILHGPPFSHARIAKNRQVPVFEKERNLGNLVAPAAERMFFLLCKEVLVEDWNFWRNYGVLRLA